MSGAGSKKQGGFLPDVWCLGKLSDLLAEPNCYDLINAGKLKNVGKVSTKRLKLGKLKDVC